VPKRRAVIDVKQIDSTGAAMKEMTWQTITQEVSATSDISRTSDEVEKVGCHQDSYQVSLVG
jgi:hypothetical protein